MIYLYWILGGIGYIFMGVVTSLIFFYFEDCEPDGRAGFVATLWPAFFIMWVTILPFYTINNLVHYAFNRIFR